METKRDEVQRGVVLVDRDGETFEVVERFERTEAGGLWGRVALRSGGVGRLVFGGVLDCGAVITDGGRLLDWPSR